MSDKQFYTSPKCLDEYERLIKYVLNRRNTYTGIRYKDDKTILAWQLGNEMVSDNAQWESTIAAYIKSIDQNHLVMEGNDDTLQELDDPNIDILDAHLYPYYYIRYSGTYNLAGLCQSLKQQIGNKKVLIVGECGLGDTPKIVALYDEVIRDGTADASSGVSGHITAMAASGSTAREADTRAITGRDSARMVRTR